MTPCDGTATSEKWCCGLKNTDCCGTDKEIVLAAVLGDATTSSSSASSSSSATTSSTTQTTPATSASTIAALLTQTPTPTPTQTTDPVTQTGLSTGGKAGIGIGSAALALIAVGGILYFVRRKKGKSSKSSKDEGLMTEYSTRNYPPQGGTQIELYGGDSTAELHGIPQHQFSEVSGNDKRIMELA